MVEFSWLNDSPVKFDYSKLRGKMVEHFGKQARFAAVMGLSERSVSLKLNGKRGWTQHEMYRACEVLRIPQAEIPNYFFCIV